MEIVNKLGFDASGAIAELQKLDQTLAQFQSRLQGTAGAANQFGSASKSVAKSFATIGTASNATANNVQSNVARMTTSLQLLSRVVFTQAIVRSLSTLRNSFKATAAEAADFQRGISLIQTIDDSKQSFDQLSASVRQLSDEFNIPLAEAVAGVYQTISNQVGDAGESFLFTSRAAEFAKATNSSLSSSVDLLSAALKSYGLQASDTERVAGVLFKTIDLGRVQADELANSFGRVGPIAADLGVSFEEVNSALAAITVRGSNTSEALTQVRAIMTALIKPSDAMEAALAKLGVSSGEAAIEAFGLFGTLEKLKAASGGSATAMAALFPNVRGLAGASSLLGDGLAQATLNLREMEAAGASLLKQKFGQAIANDGETVRREFNAIKNAVVTELGGALLDATKRFFQATDATKGLTGAIVAAKPAVDNIAAAMGLLIGQLAAAKAGAGGLAKALNLVAGVQLAQGIGDTLGGLLGDEIHERQSESIRALEAANAEELRGFTETQKAKVDAANRANQEIVESAKRFAQQARAAGIGPDQVAAALDATEGVTALEEIFGRQITTLEQYAKALEIASAKVAELKQQQLTAAQATAQGSNLQAEIAETLQRITERERTNFGGEFSEGMRAQLQSLVALFQEAAKSGQLTEEKLRQLAQFGQDFASQVESGGLLGTAFATDLNLLSEALAKLQQLKALQAQSSADPALTAQLTRLEAVLAQNPAGQFSSTTASMNAAVSPSQAIAAAWERAAAAAERAAAAALRAARAPKAKAFGGMAHLASGGLARGIDTIPAMLSPGEFVMNAQSSRKFYAQLQAMNAGQTPAFRQDGGSVSNDNSTTIGDIHLHSDPANVRELMQDIRREQRRGTARLN
jgi:TP901 family phage tail tape measure protein